MGLGPNPVTCITVQVGQVEAMREQEMLKRQTLFCTLPTNWHSAIIFCDF